MVNLDLKQFSQRPIIDLRQPQDFALCHILNASNFPIVELESRIYELPIRAITLNLFGDAEQLKNAAGLLLKAGYSIDQPLEVTVETLQQIKNSFFFQNGKQSKQLWQAAPIVEYFCQKFIPTSTRGLIPSTLPSPVAKGLDLACGSGRDSVYLAKKGWAMTSVDYSSSSIEKLQQLATRHNQSIRSLQIDLEKKFEQIEALNEQFELVLLVRYLHRPTLQRLKALIKPKGYIVYQTFMQGCEKFGSPKNPRFLLRPNELAEVFSDFDILVDKVEYLADGRPTNCFIAQKIAIE